MSKKATKKHALQHVLILDFYNVYLKESRTRLILSLVVIRVGTRGRRSSFSMNPIALSTHFTPAGFPSTKSRLNSSVNR